MDGASSVEAGTAVEVPAATGLTAAQVRDLLATVGPNALPEASRPGVWLPLLRQLTHFFALMLWVAAGLAAVAGMAQLAIAIVIVVLVNGGFAFAQEYRADRAADRLRGLMPATAVVRRDGRRHTVPATDLVPGDLVILEAGDRVSADLTAVRLESLAVDESLLTGESVPRRPGTGDPLHAGTFVVEGAGEAVVVATGTRTRLASIAALTQRTRRPTSPLALRLNRVVGIVAASAVGVGTVFFAVALLLGMPLMDGFLFALGVTVALVPEGLLPTVTLSLARGAHTMADRQALIKRLEAVQTLGSVTFICTDKTGTLTRNEMAVTEVWTPAGSARVTGVGYDPAGEVVAAAPVRAAVADVAYAGARASSGRLARRDGGWVASGDPMDVALHVLARRARIDVTGRERSEPTTARFPFDPRRLTAATRVGPDLYVKGAPEAVLARCRSAGDASRVATDMADRGLRVLAVAHRGGLGPDCDRDRDERDLTLVGIVGLLDPPRPDAAGAVAACRRAGIRLAMVTGDHPGTARAVALEVGLSTVDSPVVEGPDLPGDDDALGDLIDRDGIVLARVSPEDKLRIARVLQQRGHVVAMTGDGVNDAPALREADIGVAMGATGSDVAREAADLVLLDDRFATIVSAVELGRATFANIRRFLTYHLTDNVAELAPFLAWALSGGSFPLAIGVLQVLALDIGTDLLPALALGGEPPSRRTMVSRARTGQLIDAGVLTRAFGVLGPAEVVVSLCAFAAVLLAGGWTWGDDPSGALLATASGTAFAAIVLGQLANAFACRSEVRPVYRIPLWSNHLLPLAVGVELVLLVVFLAVGPVAGALGGAWPSASGWALAGLAVPVVLLADTLFKAALRRRFGRVETR
ncbi:cation-translocating P-type ATPase [Virgisporangium ochraceum]|uniref:Magnesium-transporting ATPase n=1 Tax=Virgisporangium ochraceum TaxID=65505 RepID=A0A8J3ZZF4_9ACTN|nr:cation-transporting P-type ATPase [Virgisporangium ochraceum]GIJ71707.1 magnesium-transporting ATPase [Virgisporangium ochraceum]